MDIALNITPVATDLASLQADLTVSGGDLVADTSLRTAVLLSLFLDRRANDDDDLPDEAADRRGWWGDAYAEEDGDHIGSRLWLLQAEKQLPAVLVRAKEYAEEALDWLKTDGIVKAVDVTAEFTRPEMLGLLIVLTRPDGTRVQYRFANVWGG